MTKLRSIHLELIGADMATARRAGGHIDRGDGKGWVLDDEPAPIVAEPRVYRPLVPPVQAAGGWVLSPPVEPAPEPVVEVEPESEPESESEPANAAEVRAWAREAGIEVSDRGRISQDVLDQYANREI